MVGTQNHLALGDLDGDGHIDVVTVGGSDGVDVAVAYGDGHGGFTPARIAVLAGLSTAGEDVALADVDGDGRPELVVAIEQEQDRPSPGRGIAVVHVGSDRGLSAPSHPTSLAAAKRVLAADLDADGHPDLVVDSSLLRGLGAGRFAPARSLAPGKRPGLEHAVRGRDLLASYDFERDGAQRLAVVARAGVPVPSADVRATDITRGLLVTGHSVSQLLSDPGLGAVLVDPLGLWFSRPAAGERYSRPVPVVLPRAARVGAVADLDGDGRSDLVSADELGTIHVLRNAGEAPLAQPLLPPRAPYFGADHSVRLRVGCSAGAGGCSGTLELAGELHAVTIPAGGATQLRVLVRHAKRALDVRFRAPLGGARQRVRLDAPTPAQRIESCSGGGNPLLARSPRYTVFDSPDGYGLVVCTRATGAQRSFSARASDSAVALHGGFVAAIEDVCPGGFEGCILGVAERGFPSGRTITRFELGDTVGALPAGRHGALAWVTCPTDGETLYCARRPGEQRAVYRLDRRGVKRLAQGRGIDVDSLRTHAGGRGFSWRQDGRRHTSSWRGAPPATLPEPPVRVVVRPLRTHPLGASRGSVPPLGTSGGAMRLLGRRDASMLLLATSRGSHAPARDERWIRAPAPAVPVGL